MFGKKVLTFIGLLFLGSQITSVSALTSCTFNLSAGCSCTCSETGYYAVFTSNTAGEYHTNVDSDSNDDGKLVYVSDTNDCEVKGTSITGFFKSPDGTIISNDYTGKALVLSDVGDCTTGNAGKLVDTNTICIGIQSDTTTPVTLTFTATNNEVYLTGDKAEVFSNDNTKSAVVGFTETTITIDKTYNDDDFCVDADTKIVTKRDENYCSNTATKDCDSYINCINGVCSAATIQERGTIGSCTPQTGTGTGCGDGYYIVDQYDAFLTSATGGTKVYSCTGGNCDDVTSTDVGYFKNADSTNSPTIPYIVCDSTHSCSAIGAIAGDTCTSAGMLIDKSGIKLCVDNVATNAMPLDGSSYLVDANDVSNNKFIASAAGAGTFVIVETDASGNAKLKAQAIGNYYAAKADKSLLVAVGDAGAGTLYKSNGATCAEDKTTIGYLKNAASDDDNVPYIQCVATGTPQEIGGVNVDSHTCKAITKPNSTKGLGKLIYDTDNSYKLCIDADTKTVVAGTPAKYLVDAHGQSTFVSKNDIKDGYYVVVEIDDKGNFIRRVQTGKKYIYAVTASKQVYDKGDENQITTMCNNEIPKSLAATSSEFVLNKTTGDLVDYYKSNTN